MVCDRVLLMANFKTHLTIASMLSGILAIGSLQANLATPQDVWVYFAAGTMGGILPDIDADHSFPIRIIFSFFAIVLAFLTVFSQVEVYSIVELCLIWLGVYVAIRYAACKMFARFTVHRGIFHSLLAACFFCVLAASVTYHLCAMSPSRAWLTGCFVGMGYIVHLVLDELYSVDFMGATCKKSFGTALKIVSLTHIKATLCLSLVTLLLLYFATPTYDTLVQTLGHWHTYTNLQDKLLPKDGWFTRQR
jgi:hypothetical protein